MIMALLAFAVMVMLLTSPMDHRTTLDPPAPAEVLWDWVSLGQLDAVGTQALLPLLLVGIPVAGFLVLLWKER